jgi:glutamyl-tRNA synthetase
MRVRFAPSPTGHLHVGNARTALFNWLLARHGGGTFILRIEDTDTERSTRESERAIVEDLRWMGLNWDEGVEAGGTMGPYRQSERLEIYADHADQLLDNGGAYYCFCSPEKLEADRQALLAQGLPPRYVGTCRSLAPDIADERISAGERPVIRLRVPQNREVVFDDIVRGRVAFHTDVIGDPVLVRSDGMPAYNFAVVIDDALMQVTHVVRGEDHISNTPRQILLYEAFGWRPPQFAHVSLVMGPDHTPLSKHHGATSVAEFRAKGYLPEALVNYLALIGWSPGEGQEVLPLDELARRFELSHVAHSAGVFDEDKLAWVNRHYLSTAEPDRLVDESLRYLREAGVVESELSDAGRAWLKDVIPAVAKSIDRLTTIPSRLTTIFSPSYDRAPALLIEGERAVIQALADELAHSPRLVDREAFRALADRMKQRTSRKGRAVFNPIRIAITGASVGPEHDLLVPAIDGLADLTHTGLKAVQGCKERAARFVELMG